MRKIYSLLLLTAALVCLPWANVMADDPTLTVADGSSLKQKLPIDGYNCDGPQHNQFIFLSSELADMNGATIKALKFYMDKNYTWSSGGAPVATFKFVEVEATSVSSLVSTEGATQVYSGQIVFANNEWNITLSTPYTYKGGNLVIDIQTTAAGYINSNSNKGSYFYSANVTYGRGNYNGSLAQEYIPKTTFTYEEAAVVGGCNKPKNLAISTELPDGATFTWEQNVDETVYQWACVASGDAVEAWNTLAENVRTKTVEGLTAGTAYDFYVRSYCGEGEDKQSDAVKKTFTPSCPAPTFGATPVSDKTHNAATITWNAADGITKYQFVNVAKDATPNWEGVEAKEVTSVELSGLTELTDYDFYVRSWYSATAQSAAVKTSFQTGADCSAKTVDAEHPWTENFTNHATNAMPTCWTAAGNTSAVYVASSSSYLTFSYGKALYFTGGSGTQAIAVLPDFATDVNTLQIAFSHIEEHASNSGKIQFGYYKDGTFTSLKGDGYDISTSWKDESAIAITGVPEGAKLAFAYKPNKSAYTAAVDNITISVYEAPACAQPENLKVDQIGTDSAVVTWTSAAANFALQYKKAGDAEWTDAIGEITSPFVLKNLLPSKTAYTVRVKADCGGSQSDWVVSSEFETQCETVTFGWSESFDAETLSECWPVTVGDASNSAWELYKYADEGTYSGYSVRFKGKSGYAASTLQTPAIVLTDKAALNFYWTNVNGLAVDVKVSTDGGTTKTSIEHSLSTATTTKKTAKSIDLSDYEGDTVILYFSAQGNSSSLKYLYIDEVSIDYAPIATPANLVAEAGNASAIVTWERAEADAKDSLRYRVKDAEPEAEWTKVANIEGKTYTIESLTNGTTYEVQVKTVASANRQSDWTASQTFTPVDCPSVETVTFGAKTYNSVVVNWTTTGAGTWNIRYKTAKEQVWTVVEGNIAENTKKLEGLTPGEVYTIAVKPSCNDDEKAWVAAAETYTPLYTAPTNVVVTNITDATASASWDAVADAPDGYLYVVSAKDAEPAWNKATQTAELTASLSNLEAATEYDLHVVTKYGQYYSSDSKVSFTTSTVAPKNLTAGEITTTTATFSWENDGAATKYQWSTDNTNWSAAQTDKTATVTGLNANTSYKFYVRSYYDENIQSAVASLSFRTECAAITVLPWILNFDELEAGQIPECWDNSGSTSATYATTPSYFWAAYKYSYDSDAKMLKMNNTMIEEGTAVINTPRIELPASPAYEFDFDYSHRADCGALIVKVSEDGGANWTDLQSYEQEPGSTSGVPSADLIEASIDLSSYAGKTIMLQFFANANYKNGAIFVDNVAVRVKSNCPVPRSVAVSAVRANTAKVAWTEKGGATAWKLQTSTDGSNWGEEIEATTNPFTLTGLTAETTYYVRVKSACEESYTDWSDASAAFTTQCAARTLPFTTEEFTTIPSCWSVDPEWELYSYDGSIRVKSYTASLKMPLIVLSEKAQLSFKHSAGADNSVKYIVYVNDGESEEQAAEMYSSTSWKQATIDLSAYIGKTVNIIFRSSSSSYFLYLDDVAVNFLPVAAPTNLTATPANASAVVTWERAEADAKDSLRYRVNGSEAEWTKVANIEGKTYTIESLTNGTTYEVQVKTVASANRQSDWTASAVVTPMACPTITGIELSEKTYNSVKVSWTASGTGTWVLEYGLNAPYTVVENLAVTEYVLDNLTPGETYTIKVHPNCSEESLQTTYYPAYTAPTNVVVTNINDVTATASWDAVADMTGGYEYAVVPRGTDAGTWANSKITNETSVELTGLAAGTEYDFHVVSLYPGPYTPTKSPDVKVEFATITVAPKNLTAGEITTTAATFTWEANGAATQYQWSTDNTNWSDAQTDLTATATGLTAGTAYTFYVRSYYAEGKYSEPVSLAFATACDVYDMPYAESFETAGKPLCWETTGTWTTNNEYAHSGNALRADVKNKVATLTMPAIAISEADAELVFYVRNVYGGSSHVSGEVIITPTVGDAKHVAVSNSNNINNKQKVDLSEFNGKDVVISFSFSSVSSTAYVFIDDVTVAKKQCAIPTNLTVQAGNAKADVAWTKGEDETAWQLQYKATAAVDWTLVENITSEAYSITGLVNGTEYEVQVRAYCDENHQSEWTASATFTPSVPSGFDNTNAEGNKTVKLIENDQIVIIRDGVKYNAQGQKLQ